MAGKFSKKFCCFDDGVEALMDVSNSAAKALCFSGAMDDYYRKGAFRSLGAHGASIAALALNMISIRPWDETKPSFSLREGGNVDYRTGGGLTFGWEAIEDNGRVAGWKFYIVHPDGPDARPESTLRKSALAHSWSEE